MQQTPRRKQNFQIASDDNSLHASELEQVVQHTFKRIDMQKYILQLAIGALVFSSNVSAQTRSAKDIVLDRVAAPVISTAPVAAPANDAMAVSVLVESIDGTLTPRSTQNVFKTGDRFRVKILAARDGVVELYNTNPKGETTAVWKGEVKVGLETISPRLRLEGTSGEDQLHVVLIPSQPPSGGIGNWLSGLFKGTSKDIRLDVQNTANSTYVVNTGGQGASTTVRIVHF
jgi:hypothetical protein